VVIRSLHTSELSCDFALDLEYAEITKPPTLSKTKVPGSGAGLSSPPKFMLWI
jgi:hypothetical protein